MSRGRGHRRSDQQKHTWTWGRPEGPHVCLSVSAARFSPGGISGPYMGSWSTQLWFWQAQSLAPAPWGSGLTSTQVPDLKKGIKWLPDHAWFVGQKKRYNHASCLVQLLAQTVPQIIKTSHVPTKREKNGSKTDLYWFPHHFKVWDWSYQGYHSTDFVERNFYSWYV